MDILYPTTYSIYTILNVVWTRLSIFFLYHPNFLDGRASLMSFEYKGWYIFVKPFGTPWHAQKCGVELEATSQELVKAAIDSYGR